MQLEIPGAKHKKWGEHEIESLSSHFSTGSGRNTHNRRMHSISTYGIWPQMQQSPFQLRTNTLEERKKNGISISANERRQLEELEWKTHNYTASRKPRAVIEVFVGRAGNLRNLVQQSAKRMEQCK